MGEHREISNHTAEERRLSEGELNTAIVHFYRAQSAKADVWRARLDTTTNWAVVTTAAAITFTFGDTEPQRHAMVLLISMLVSFFLVFEARRYRHYDIWQTRVHLLEADYLAPLIEPGVFVSHTDWRQLLSADLKHPEYHISFAEAIGWRLRRNYIWIYATLLATWVIKLLIHPEAIGAPQQFVSRAALGPISGWLVIGLVGLFSSLMVLLALVTARYQTASGEIMDPEETRRKIQQAAPIATNSR
jgi:uncharacterized membrane protein